MQPVCVSRSLRHMPLHNWLHYTGWSTGGSHVDAPFVELSVGGGRDRALHVDGVAVCRCGFVSRLGECPPPTQCPVIHTRPLVTDTHHTTHVCYYLLEVSPAGFPHLSRIVVTPDRTDSVMLSNVSASSPAWGRMVQVSCGKV
ncbi:hypothetical protein SFRURICE_017732 [Spodoptera frugiperda]|uniref:SFRICE_010430 n=1 Tax=Spodoptera frugiperda TaxID=7108 RepID=A0A2H1VXF8_SPOFR|nr:hypothetical protein SFRURICE_017732 [Spodoptera frugiperda]